MCKILPTAAQQCRDKLYNEFRKTEVIALKSYIRPMCSKLCASTQTGCLGCSLRCHPQVRLLTSFVDHTIDLPGEIFYVQCLGQSSRGKYANFCSYPNFLATQFRRGQSWLPCQKSSWFDTVPACDGQMDGWAHSDRICHASIASHCKNQKYLLNRVANLASCSCTWCCIVIHVVAW